MQAEKAKAQAMEDLGKSNEVWLVPLTSCKAILHTLLTALTGVDQPTTWDESMLDGEDSKNSPIQIDTVPGVNTMTEKCIFTDFQKYIVFQGKSLEFNVYDNYSIKPKFCLSPSQIGQPIFGVLWSWVCTLWGFYKKGYARAPSIHMTEA